LYRFIFCHCRLFLRYSVPSHPHKNSIHYTGLLTNQQDKEVKIRDRQSAKEFFEGDRPVFLSINRVFLLPLTQHPQIFCQGSAIGDYWSEMSDLPGN
jgi:hypothetical protein